MRPSLPTFSARFGADEIGLWVGTILSSGLGYLPGTGSGAAVGDRRERTASTRLWIVLICGLLLTLPIAFLAIQGDFFDEFAPAPFLVQQ